MSKQFDIVLWGATGFTGQLVAEYLVRHAPKTMRWALAGRNEAKLETVRRQLTAVSDHAADLPILLADSHDRPSLEAMVNQTRVVCTTVGPYALYGSLLVELCVAAGVAYCDLTGEVTWIRQMIDQFHEQAQQTGAKIVHCCGFDSIPSDLGTLMVQEHALAEYGRSCQTVYHVFLQTKGGVSGGTVASLMALVEQGKSDKQLRKLLADPYNLVPGHSHDSSEKDQMGAEYVEALETWTGPFLMAAINTRIVRRSHALLGYPWGEEFQYKESMKMSSGVTGRIAANAFGWGMQLFTLATAVDPIRNLLKSTVLPKPGEGPSAETRESGFFKSTLIGTLPASEPEPEIEVVGYTVGVGDPGYQETAKMLSESALCLAFDKLPDVSGVLTPASAMGMTLVERLRQANMTFYVESGLRT